jgi:hypothetical protein
MSKSKEILEKIKTLFNFEKTEKPEVKLEPETEPEMPTDDVAKIEDVKEEVDVIKSELDVIKEVINEIIAVVEIQEEEILNKMAEITKKDETIMNLEKKVEEMSKEPLLDPTKLDNSSVKKITNSDLMLERVKLARQLKK